MDLVYDEEHDTSIEVNRINVNAEMVKGKNNTT